MATVEISQKLEQDRQRRQDQASKGKEAAGKRPLGRGNRAMDDGLGGRGAASGAAGGEEEDGDSTQRAVPDEAAHVGSSSTRKRRRRGEATNIFMQPRSL